MDQAISRAAGTQRIEGNRVRLLRDATENYPAWLEAIASARDHVYFEAYILRDDVSGRRFADALIERARAGVSVRVLYDWLGAIGKTPARFWATLRAAGIDVRCFNPFTLASPLGWIHRDHRKSIVVDDQVGFVTGLCVGDAWVGDPERGIAPWRDTGIEIRGPAVAEVARAFSRVWQVAAPAGSSDTITVPDSIPIAGTMPVRVVATEPWSARLLRIDELVAGAARETLWLTDAYYAGMPSHVQAMSAAALDGVDVRLLVPGGTDIPLLQPLSQAGYRPLLEAGVRVFEWNGPMMHAKTAVADGRIARVGSSNLNVASWLGNYELDVVIEDPAFADLMTESYLDDLSHSTEVVLNKRGHRRKKIRRNLEVAATAGGPHAADAAAHGNSGGRNKRWTGHRDRRKHGGSAGRGVAGAIRLGNTVSAAVTHHRVLARADSRPVAVAGSILVILAAAIFFWPRMIAIPIAVLCVWFGASFLRESFVLHRRPPAPDDVISRSSREEPPENDAA
jgi:cardiolipin synthase